MEKEIKDRLAIIKYRLANDKLSSEQIFYMHEIQDELQNKLKELSSGSVKLHIAEDAVCESCQ